MAMGIPMDPDAYDPVAEDGSAEDETEDTNS
jgi:hypothetical protein